METAWWRREWPEATPDPAPGCPAVAVARLRAGAILVAANWTVPDLVPFRRDCVEVVGWTSPDPLLAILGPVLSRLAQLAHATTRSITLSLEEKEKPGFPLRQNITFDSRVDSGDCHLEASHLRLASELACRVRTICRVCMWRAQDEDERYP
jgi:hypothetical protein